MGIVVASIVLICLTYYAIFVNVAKVSAQAAQLSVTKPLEVNFNKKVSHKAAISLEPNTDYVVSWTDSLISSSVKIVPKTRWQASTRYDLSVNEVKTVLGQKVLSLDFSFQTQNASKIISSTPSLGAVNIPTDSAMVLVLDSPNENLISPLLTFTPETKYKAELAPDKLSYNIIFEEKLKQSTQYKLGVTDAFHDPGTPEAKLLETNFQTVPKVTIIDFAPQGNMNLKDSTVKLVFDNNMDKKAAEKAFSINPVTEGSFSWPDERTLVLTPKTPLLLNTTYNVLLNSGVKNTFGGTLEENYVASFATIGYVTASFTPGWGASEVGLNTAIRVYFNQEVDHGSAQNNFVISPNVPGNFSWSTNTMIFSPNGQSPLTNYQVTQKAGVRSVNGLDSAQSFSTSYTTITPINILGVSFHRQIYNLSCEAAALVIALGEKGVSVSEDALLVRLGHDGPLEKTADNKWGNPNRGFVGSVGGNGTTTGYGVHWGPVAIAASAYRSSQAFTGGNLQTLTAAVDGGNPIIIWGTIGNPYSMSWIDFTTGETVSAVKGEHTRVVKGYKGLASNPLGFYIVDPIYGNLYWDSSTLLGNWGWFGYSGVIIY